MTSAAATVDVETEKTIVRNALLRLFNPTMTTALIEGFYSQNNGLPQFLEAATDGQFTDEYAAAPQPQAEPEALEVVPEPVYFAPEPAVEVSPFDRKPSFRFEVADFTDNYFAKDYFPKFRVQVVAANGVDPIPAHLNEMQVRISVRNKWVDVTSEVLPSHTDLVRTIKGGFVDISDLMFMDVSLKHGGFFSVELIAVGQEYLVQTWKSPKFAIQSVKTHCNKKRKSRTSTPAPNKLEEFKTPEVVTATRKEMFAQQDAIEVDDVKSFLMPPAFPMDMFSLPMDAAPMFGTDTDLQDLFA